MRWKELVTYISGEVKDFNTVMGRQFLEFQSFENEVEVHAPKLWLKVWIDVGVPDIKFAFQEPFPSLKQTRSGHFALALQGEQVCIIDAEGLALSSATVGESLLDPLVA